MAFASLVPRLIAQVVSHNFLPPLPPLSPLPMFDLFFSVVDVFALLSRRRQTPYHVDLSITVPYQHY